MVIKHHNINYNQYLLKLLLIFIFFLIFVLLCMAQNTINVRV